MSMALLASAWTFFRISGSVFNPNVALALLMTGALKPM
jgi:aquaporin related protein